MSQLKSSQFRPKDLKRGLTPFPPSDLGKGDSVENRAVTQSSSSNLKVISDSSAKLASFVEGRSRLHRLVSCRQCSP